MNAVVLAPLPFRNPEQLVRVTADFPKQPLTDVGLSVPELFDLRAADLFDDIAGVWPISANLTETDEPERLETALVDANYFSMLGIGASVGRVFDTTDAQPGIAEVAVISEALWKRRFGGDGDVLGKRIRIDNDMYSIIGVAPASFRHPGRGTETDVEIRAPAGWLASPFSPQPIRRAYILQGGLARLKPAGERRRSIRSARCDTSSRHGARQETTFNAELAESAERKCLARPACSACSALIVVVVKTTSPAVGDASGARGRSATFCGRGRRRSRPATLTSRSPGGRAR